jgi:hypothetical protein
MTVAAAEEDHSRFNEEHYRNCQDCYDAHCDFMQECEMDARADEAAERAQYEEEDY